MPRFTKNGLVGIGVGIASGILAGILLAPKSRRTSDRQSLSAEVADAIVSAAQAGLDVVHTVRQLGRAATDNAMAPDERLTQQIREQLEGLALWGPHVDITTIDGVVYVRGRETNAQRADAIVHVVESIEGVARTVDELRRV